TPGAITTANLEQQKEGAVMENLSNPTTAARPLRMPFGRRGLFLIGLALVAGGAAFNWGWLTAIGAAPIILSLAPCALMCVAGLCMAGGSKSCAAKSAPAMKPEPERD
ncbi:MAG TPA: hypothetical protein VFJ13_05860, partial [Paracoccaceae bacterium]|nr:hypothetical protein [Paracoccaceae bacterium]